EASNHLGGADYYRPSQRDTCLRHGSAHPLGSPDTPVAARCGVDRQLVFPIGRPVMQIDGRRRTPMMKLIERYPPERHYMRGPGPKWLEKHNGGINRIGPVAGHHHSDKYSLADFFFQLLRGRRA